MRAVTFAGLAIVLVGVATFALMRVWRSESARMGHVVEYQVVDDNTAFVLWEADDVGERDTAYLSRVNESGNTVWTREVPGGLPLNEAIRISNSVVGVRYWRTQRDRSGSEHSMIAFAYDGTRLWDVVLTPYRGASDGQRTTQIFDEPIGGAVVGDRFVEWAHTGSKWIMIGLDQRTGRQQFENEIGEPPSVFSATSIHLVWEDAERGEARVRRALQPGEARVIQVHSLDVMTGNVHHATAAGHGCMLDGNYITAVPNGSGQSLIVFSRGDLSARSELSSQFDPLGDGRPFSLLSCARYRGQLVFAIETVEGRMSQLAVAITDGSAKAARAIRLPFDTLQGLHVGIPGGLAHQAPLTGELSRFAPVIVPAAGRPDNELVMLDLDTAEAAWRLRFDSAVLTNLFRLHTRWYFTKIDNKRLYLSAFDGESGKLIGAINGSPVEADAWFEQLLLPLHVAPQSVWLVPRDRTAISALPVTVLDAAELGSIRSSARIRVKDIKSEVSARIVMEPPKL